MAPLHETLMRANGLREPRAGWNAFRVLNDRFRELAWSEGSQATLDSVWEFICECDDVECVEPVLITLAEYDERTGGDNGEPILASGPHGAGPGPPSSPSHVRLVDPCFGSVPDVDCDWEWDGSTIACEVRSERAGEDIFVVSLAGEHDLYTAPKVREALRGVIAAGAMAVVVDLTETTFLDSTMLQVLLSARNDLRDGGRLLLVTNDATVMRVFEISGTDRLFEFYPSRGAAEAEVRSP